jgi:hypothetical protein
VLDAKRTWIGQIAFARGAGMQQNQEVRRGATLNLLLFLAAGGLLAGGLSSTLYAPVASLAPGPEQRRTPAVAASAAVQHEAFARRSVGVNSPPALWPSPYEFAPTVGLAPNPYGEIAALAPDPYRNQHAADRAAAWSQHEVSVRRRRVVDTRPRLALAPSPYELAPVMDLVPNPY